MGNCFQPGPSDQMPKYSKTLIISLKTDTQTTLSSSSSLSNRIKLKLADPSKQLVHSSEIGSYKFICSACVFPGQDPHELSIKECQDSVNVISKPDYLLATLLDGHGPKGDDVVKFCEAYMASSFLGESFTNSNLPEYLEDLFLQCDDELISPSQNINTFGSGTTAIALIVSDTGLHIASVGDSRAIMATLPCKSVLVQKVKSEGKFKTDFVPARAVEALQLTIDQKPNLEAEMARIVKSGGLVAKALNLQGDPHGEYRVFQAGKDIPALAMSRSLGDVAGKQVGVIAEPIVDFFPILPFADQFVVLASDGVWDVMSNEEVASFLETFRKRCTDKVADPFDEFIFGSQCTPARLLAEEARLRWMNLCPDKMENIDDISVIIVEIMCKELGEECKTSQLVGTTRSSSKNLGSVIEIHSDMIAFKTRNSRNTVTDFEQN